MANQPKKYKKFVATAATATLVASAIVPVASAASFTDVPDNSDFKAFIDELVEQGLINGYQDGTFKPNQTLTRAHVVKMLGRYLEKNGFEIPADWATVQRFNDLPVTAQDSELVKYAALVKDAGVFSGSNGNLNYAQNIQRQQMAKVLNFAYKAVNGKELVELAANTQQVTVNDLDQAVEEFRPYIQALANLGITTVSNYRPAEPVTRGQFAKFLSITIKGGSVTPSTPDAGEVQISSAEATGVSQITVKFNKAVDTEAAKFAVARGTTSISVKDVDWSEDKKEAVLTVDTKFADATYTVTVSGVGEKDLTASFSTTREEVAKIEFLSDKLVFTGVEQHGFKQAVIAFAVYNQYGEDITKNVINSRYEDPKVKRIDVAGESDAQGKVEAPRVKDGKFIVWVDKDEDEDQEGSVQFTYKNGDYEIDAYQDVVLSEVSEPGYVEIVDVYNASGKTLTTKNMKDVAKGDEDFYLLFKVKDQYGVEIDPEFADDEDNAVSGDTTLLKEVQDGLRISVSDKDIFELEDEDKIEIRNVDGEYYFALQIIHDNPDDVEAGENTVEFRAKATGEIATKVFKVEASSEVHKIELLAPDEVIAGDETVKMPVVVTDQNGEEITDAGYLNDELRRDESSGQKPGIKIDADMDWIKGSDEKTAFRFIEENGKVYLEFETEPNNAKALGKKAKIEDIDIEVKVEKSDEESEITLKLQPDAYPAKLVGLKNKSKEYFHKDDKYELKLKDFIIEDQYGRVLDDVTKLGENFSLSISALSNSVIDEHEDSTGFSTVVNDANEITGTTGKIYLKTEDANGKTAKGSGAVEFELYAKDYTEPTENNEGKTITDKLSVTFRAVEDADFKSYTVKSDGILYGKYAEDDADIEVYGVLTNGVEVELPTDKGLYQVIPGDYLIGLNAAGVEATSEDVVNVVADVDAIADEDLFGPSGNQSIETNVKVVINENGQVIEHKLTINEERPKGKELKLKDKNSISEAKITKLDVEVTAGVVDADAIIAALQNAVKDTAAEGNLNPIIEDQYGNIARSAARDDQGEFIFKFFDDTAQPSSKFTLTVSDVVSQDDDVKVKNNGRSTVSIGDATHSLEDGDYFTLTIAIDGVSATIRVNVIDEIAG